VVGRQRPPVDRVGLFRTLARQTQTP
jgi:hypothetical protein